MPPPLLSQSPVGYIITLLWAFSFCSGGKVCAGGKQLHSLSTCPCFLLNKITAKARNLDLGCLHSCAVIHTRTFVLYHVLLCKTVQQKLDLPLMSQLFCSVFLFARTSQTSQSETSSSQFSEQNNRGNLIKTTKQQ